MRAPNRVKSTPLPRLREAIVEAYAGSSVRAVAQRFKVSVRQVLAVLDAAGVDRRPVGRPAAADPDVAARLRTLAAPSRAPGPPPLRVPSSVLSVAQASPAEPAPESAAAARAVSAFERRVFDFGQKLDDLRPVLWRCPACRRPIHEPGLTHCPCGWAFITRDVGWPRGLPRRPPSNIVAGGYDIGPANWIDAWP